MVSSWSCELRQHYRSDAKAARRPRRPWLPHPAQQSQLESPTGLVSFSGRSHMVFRRWQEATQSIAKLTGRCTPEQLAIASAAELPMRSALPRLVAAARLRQHLHSSLGTDPPRPVHPYERDVLAELVLELQRREPKCDTATEADAWIQYLRLRLRCRMLRPLRLYEGDIIRRSMADPDEVDAVSSIGGDGRVYLKGGKGARAWPDTLTMVARSADNSAHAAEWRRKAANRAAQRAQGESWSGAKAAMLEPYAVVDAITESDVEELRDIVESAKDERPLQKFIEDHPTVLARRPSRTVLCAAPATGDRVRAGLSRRWRGLCRREMDARRTGDAAVSGDTR